MNLPNKLTIFRILLVPVMVIIPYLNISGNFLGISIAYWIMGLIFIIVTLVTSLILYAISKDARNLFKRAINLIKRKLKAREH